ncbi:hypothetical protein MUP77_01540 [Candidatus Bathyarchaeota archaeon]|nr:hypothetical protein [Candidatus Bathyarchaeota archaeon]
MSPHELRLKIRGMLDEQNLLDHTIEYFAQYGEPRGFTGISEILMKRKESLKEKTKSYQIQLNEVSLMNLVANKIP